MPVTIKIPEKDSDYSLYICGKVIGKYYEKGKGTLLSIEGVAAAFYSYSRYRRAYVFCEKELLDDKTPLMDGNLPLIKQRVGIIYFAEGRRIDVLKNLCHNINELFGTDAYSYSVDYWLRATALVDKVSMFKGEDGRTERRIRLLTQKYKKRQYYGNK